MRDASRGLRLVCGATRVAGVVSCAGALAAVASLAHAEDPDPSTATDDARVTFAVVGQSTIANARDLETSFQSIAAGPAQFVVQFDQTPASPASCTDGAVERRRALLDGSAKPVVPVVAGAAWSDCGDGGGARTTQSNADDGRADTGGRDDASPDAGGRRGGGAGRRASVRADGGPIETGDPSSAVERLTRIGDALFADDDSLGRTRLRWVRQSATHRFGRYRENVRWQAGRVLFATFNLPNNNNNYRLGAGRNGEFEERAVANRAWLERTFRIARERRLAGVVLFVDAAPRFGQALRAPDPASRERDGYYEWKMALREQLATFKHPVLLVQGHVRDAGGAVQDRHPLHDAAGHPIATLTRVTLPDPGTGERWLRIAVDPSDPRLFVVTAERAFDDPSGELYGVAKGE